MAGNTDVIVKMINDGVDINATVTEVHSYNQLLYARKFLRYVNFADFIVTY